MKSAISIELPKEKNDDILFDDRLIELGVLNKNQRLKGRALRIRRGSGGRIMHNWIIQYRAHGHARRMIVADAAKVSTAEGHKRAKKLLAKVELGGDPQAEKQARREKDSISLRGVVTEFLASKTGLRENSMRPLRLYLEKGPYLGSLRGMPIDRITRRDVATRVLAVQRDSGVCTAGAFRAAMSSLFRWALETGLTETNPMIGAHKPPQPEPRDRALSDQELAAIWRSLDDDDFGKCIKLVICFGCRRSEIAGMRWSEFDFDKGAWSLPKERSKNKRPHTLPLTPLVKQIIDSVPRRDGTDFLFGSRGTRGFTAWSLGKDVLDERLGSQVKKWQTRDLRRSVATGMANIGVAPHVVEQILNHQSGHRRGVAGTYNRSLYEREVKAAVALWSDHIRSITEGGARKVVAFERSAKELEERYVSTGEGMTFTHPDGMREKIARGKNGKLVVVKDTGDARGAKGS
jgi:integrase